MKKMMRYAILNGLCSEIATYETQQNPTNIDQLLAAARVAELTMSSQSTHDSALHAKVDSWEKMSINPIRDNRSPTPTRKQVTFTPADRQPPTSQSWTRRPFRPNSPYPRAQFTEQTGPRFRSGAPRGQFQRQQPIRPQTQSSQTARVPNADIFRIFTHITVRQSIRLAAHAGKEDTSQLCVEVEPHGRALGHSNMNEGDDRVQPTVRHTRRLKQQNSNNKSINSEQ